MPIMVQQCSMVHAVAGVRDSQRLLTSTVRRPDHYPAPKDSKELGDLASRKPQNKGDQCSTGIQEIGCAKPPRSGVGKCPTISIRELSPPSIFGPLSFGVSLEQRPACAHSQSNYCQSPSTIESFSIQHSAAIDHHNTQHCDSQPHLTIIEDHHPHVLQAFARRLRSRPHHPAIPIRLLWDSAPTT